MRVIRRRSSAMRETATERQGRERGERANGPTGARVRV